MIEFTKEMNDLQEIFESYGDFSNRTEFKIRNDAPEEAKEAYKRWCKLVDEAFDEMQ